MEKMKEMGEKMGGLGAVVHFRAVIDDPRRIKMPQNLAAQWLQREKHNGCNSCNEKGGMIAVFKWEMGFLVFDQALTVVQGFFSRGLPLKCLSIENLIWAGLGVSRTIYVNADSPNLVFPYFNFLWEAQCKKTPCTMKQSKYFFGIMDEISSPVKLFPILVPPDRVDWSVRVITAKRWFW